VFRAFALRLALNVCNDVVGRVMALLVCCRVLPCVAKVVLRVMVRGPWGMPSCSVLQRVAECRKQICRAKEKKRRMMVRAMCCSVLQRVAACYSVLTKRGESRDHFCGLLHLCDCTATSTCVCPLLGGRQTYTGEPPRDALSQSIR